MLIGMYLFLIWHIPTLWSCRLNKQRVFSLAGDAQGRLQIVSEAATAPRVWTEVKSPSVVYQLLEKCRGGVIPEARICLAGRIRNTPSAPGLETEQGVSPSVHICVCVFILFL